MSDAPINTVLQMQDCALANSSLPPLAYEVSRNSERILAGWNSPEAIRVAALLIPLVKSQPSLSRKLAATFDQRPLQLSTQAVQICPQDMSKLDSGPASFTKSTLKLRELFRLAYLAPDLILLLLAQQDGVLQVLDQLPELVRRRIATETEEVFVPMVEMCGIWSFRRCWLDRTAWALNPEESRRIASDLSDTELGRMNAFVHLKKQLEQGTAREGIQCEIQCIEPHVGTIHHRYKKGESRDELIARVSVRILCNSTADCYRLLGLAHSLGDRVGARFSKRMEDYIAAPQANAYRSLHSAIMFKGSQDWPGETLVELRILTHEMNEINELGLARCRYAKRATDNSPAWWACLEGQSEELRDRWKFAEGLRTFLGKFDLGTHSNPVYVFTPRGEIHFLPDGSTPPDFAYHVHTQLGHHATRIWVNGTARPYQFPLMNGDIVRVEYDTRFLGPELFWLDCAITPSARAKIRRGLTARWKSIHPSRARIADLVLKIIRNYERESGYKFYLAEHRLDAFLLRLARARGLRDLNELYEQVAQATLMPEKIAQRFIAEELGRALVQADGSPLGFPLYRISFCQHCHPFPGQPLIALKHRVGKATQGLTIHRRDNPGCLGTASRSPQVELHWLDASVAKSCSEICVTGLDRHHLLGDVLDAIYDESGLYVQQTNAEVTPNKVAQIFLTVEFESWEQLAHVQTRISEIRSVQRVHSLPVRQVSFFETQQLRQPPNPYVQQEVYSREMFFDRDEPIRVLMEWLQTRSGWFVLHGQRRVGKTSLAKYLAFERLPGHPFFPVYVDLQGLGGGTADEVLGYIGGKVYQGFERARNKKLGFQPGPECTSPAATLSALLEHTVRELKGERLFIVLDEFDLLLDRVKRGEMDPLVLKNLHAVMREGPELLFLLIIQEGFYDDAETWGAAADLIQKAKNYLLLPLDRSSASKLVTRPAGQLGLQYEAEREKDNVVDEIQSLTAGNPFFIHLLCWHLVERVRNQGRNVITHGDLQWVTDAVLGEGDRHFNHFLQSPSLRGIGRIVLSYAATRIPENDWARLGPVLSDLVRLTKKRIDRQTLNNAVQALVRIGILETECGSRFLRVRIPVGLFHRWARRNLDVEAAIAEWWEIRKRR